MEPDKGEERDSSDDGVCDVSLHRNGAVLSMVFGILLKLLFAHSSAGTVCGCFKVKATLVNWQDKEFESNNSDVVSNVSNQKHESCHSNVFDEHCHEGKDNCEREKELSDFKLPNVPKYLEAPKHTENNNTSLDTEAAAAICNFHHSVYLLIITKFALKYWLCSMNINSGTYLIKEEMR